MFDRIMGKNQIIIHKIVIHCQNSFLVVQICIYVREENNTSRRCYLKLYRKLLHYFY